MAIIVCKTCKKPRGLAFGTGYLMPADDAGTVGDGRDWYCSEPCHPLAPFPTPDELAEARKKLDPREQLVSELYDRNPDALLVGVGPEEVAAFKAALIGITDDPHGKDARAKGVDDHWPRTPGVWVAVYSVTKCVEITAGMMGDNVGDDAYAGALEWFHHNTAGGWHGPGTPCFAYDAPDDGADAPDDGADGADHHPCCNIVQAKYPGRVKPKDVGVCNCDAMWEWERGIAKAIGECADEHGQVELADALGVLADLPELGTE